MARIENQPRVILTQEERKVLRKAQEIFEVLSVGDKDDDIFNEIDNYDSNFCWMATAIENLVNMSEVEENEEMV